MVTLSIGFTLPQDASSRSKGGEGRGLQFQLILTLVEFFSMKYKIHLSFCELHVFIGTETSIHMVQKVTQI